MGTMPRLDIKGTIADRMEVIAPLVKGRKTLDLGVVDSRRARQGTAGRLEGKSSSLLFRRICAVNPDALGVDIDAEGIDILRQEGRHVKIADVMTMDLQEQFEVVVAGELIEHLPDPGQFLCNTRKHLTSEGTLVLTTPNPFSCRQAWMIWRHGRPRIHEEHVCWFDPVTLCQLCHQCALEPYAVYWIRATGGNVLKTWPRWFRQFFSESFMVLARPVPSGCLF
jgi:SAM-dependent methyltransferase